MSVGLDWCLITVVAFRLGFRLCALLKFLSERHVVEEDPGVVELAVPGPLEITHGWNQLVELLVADERDQCRAGPRGVGAVGRIVAICRTP